MQESDLTAELKILKDRKSVEQLVSKHFVFLDFENGIISMAAPQALECANGAHWVGRGPAVGVVQSKAILVSI